jgi:hypothetical protein
MHRSTLKTIGTVLAGLLLHVGPSNSQQRVISKSSIQGIVVRLGTNDPIAGARVTLIRSNAGVDSSSPSSRTATTNAGGVFVFPGLDAGLYRLEAARNGYVRQAYGQRVVNGFGTDIKLNPGQALQDLTIYLVPAGSVDGVVSDSAGNPVVGLPVELLRRTFDQSGRQILHLSGSTRTNDRGEYRFYWVNPGRYYINAGSAKGTIGRARNSGNSPNETSEDYESAYYPGVTDVGQASVVEVRPGDQVSAIDVRVAPLRVYRIRGRVIDARTGRPPAAPTISLSYLSATGLGSTLYSDVSETYDSRTGLFEFRDVAPGSYVLGAAISEKAVDPEFSSLQATVMAPVTVSESDVENVTLAAPPPMLLAGQVRSTAEPISAVPNVASIRLQLDPSINGVVMRDVPAAQPQFQWASADGGFVMSNTSPGEYRLRVIGLPPDYFVKAARFAQADVVNEPMHFSGANSGSLDVLISPNGGRIDGAVVNKKQEPMAGIQAVLIPERLRDRADLYKTAMTDSTGHFTIRGIPPGDYKVFAWEALEDFAYYDPDLIRAFEQKGAPVRILESSKESLEVKVIQ